ncbi:MAG: valine--tRNA ligase [Thermoplasmataceae archaeon]
MDLDLKAMELKWLNKWKNKGKKEYKGGSAFLIDTPPPTVSGIPHIGHAFSYPVQDMIARYRRMKGDFVFYPWGFDNNGLATERYAEKERGFKVSNKEKKEVIQICKEVSEETIKRMFEVYERFGLSSDFNNYLTTYSQESWKISQKMFLELARDGRAYRSESLTIRCPTCKTAISQIEMKDEILKSEYFFLDFKGSSNEEVRIATTRPELLGACVALCVNPADERFSSLVGKEFSVPLYGNKVKLIVDESVEPDKGSGAEMICTFGDQNDYEIWKKNNMEKRIIIDEKGRVNDGKHLLNKSIQEARALIIELLEKGQLIRERKKIEHSVNTHERCGTPLELGISKQWFIACMNLKDELLAQGSKIVWHPEFMKTRYDNWVKGLKWDWCISRQRPYGIPIPAYYCESCEETFFPDDDKLPIDPAENVPKCPQCGSSAVSADKDVMDTWATSSLSPFLYLQKAGIESKFDIMTARFQGHDIISTWAFTTILRSYLHGKTIPWEHIFISGNVMDAQGAKMSKSKGNTSYPEEIIEKYGADSMRFWASAYSMGEDARLREQELTRGRRTVIKLFNASKLVTSFSADRHIKSSADVNSTHNSWIMEKLSGTISAVTSLMEAFELAKARLELDKFFWEIFCDDYLEICKGIMNSGNFSKNELYETAAVSMKVMDSILRMYAPFLPFITEECHEILGFSGSVHDKQWPEEALQSRKTSFDTAIEAIHKIRTLKSALKAKGSDLKKVRLGNTGKIGSQEIAIMKAATRLEEIIEFNSGELSVEAI